MDTLKKVDRCENKRAIGFGTLPGVVLGAVAGQFFKETNGTPSILRGFPFGVAVSCLIRPLFKFDQRR